MLCLCISLDMNDIALELSNSSFLCETTRYLTGILRGESLPYYHCNVCKIFDKNHDLSFKYHKNSWCIEFQAVLLMLWNVSGPVFYENTQNILKWFDTWNKPLNSFDPFVYWKHALQMLDNIHYWFGWLLQESVAWNPFDFSLSLSLSLCSLQQVD